MCTYRKVHVHLLQGARVLIIAALTLLSLGRSYGTTASFVSTTTLPSKPC